MLATLFFAAVVGARNKWREIANRTALKYLLYVTLFIGVLYYGFYFYGLQHTTPGNAGLIAQTEILFTFLFFHVWRKDHIPRKHIFGALLMLAGAAIVLLPNFNRLNPGDMLIVAAMMMAPFGNNFQQKARKEISSETMMFVRSLLATPLVFLLAYALGNTISLGDLRTSWVAIAVNGLVLLGLSKIFWIESIHRISVTKALALGSFGPLLTLLFAWAILGQPPTIFQLSAFGPLFFGILLLTSRKGARPAAPVVQ